MTAESATGTVHRAMMTAEMDEAHWRCCIAEEAHQPGCRCQARRPWRRRSRITAHEGVAEVSEPAPVNAVADHCSVHLQSSSQPRGVLPAEDARVVDRLPVVSTRLSLSAVLVCRYDEIHECPFACLLIGGSRASARDSGDLGTSSVSGSARHRKDARGSPRGGGEERIEVLSIEMAQSVSRCRLHPDCCVAVAQLKQMVIRRARTMALLLQ